MNTRNVVKFLITALVIMFSPAQAKQEASLSEGMVNPGYEEQPAWFKSSFLDINEDIEEARESGKRLMLFFYQDGCPYCKKLLEDNFGQRKIAEKTQKNFDVVSINIWGDREVVIGDEVTTEKKLAEKLKVMYTPTLVFFNEKGKAVLRTNGYYHPGKFNATLDYVLQHAEKKETFHKYLSHRKTKSGSGKLHREVETRPGLYSFDKPVEESKSHRLIMFEQKQCQLCDELHQDVLKREESVELLKSFDTSVIDIWSDKKITDMNGKVLKMSDYSEREKIQYAPSLVFFDKQGKEVFRTDGYLKSFHVQSVMDYVSSYAYKKQPNFQRYIEDRAAKLRAMGVEVDIMK
jgi:thioredoxin-related protein